MGHLWNVVSEGASPGAMLHLPGHGTEPLGFDALLERAESTATRLLAARGGRPPRRVGLLMNNGEPWLRGFLATLRLDAQAVPLPLPVAFSGADAYAAHLLRIVQDSAIDVLLVDSETGGRLLSKAVGLFGDITVEDLSQPDSGPGPSSSPQAGPGDPAVLQYTSGSTSRPKGVVLTHGNVATSLRTMAEVCNWTHQDRFGSWLPLFHDMGLFGVLASMAGGASSVHLWRPTDFVRRPMDWLRQFAAAGATGVAVPNFFFDHLAEAARRKEIPADLDLSHWRFAVSGAEPVRLRSIEAFHDTFGSTGLRTDLVRPAFGMAEATLMVTYPQRNTAVTTLAVDRGQLSAGQQTQPVERTDERARIVVSCGEAVPGMGMRIADPDGKTYRPGTVGEIQISGPAVTGGYLGLAEADQPFTPDGWLKTGDLGFVTDDCLYVTGRIKDMITIRGENFYAEDVEEIARTTTGARGGTCAAFAWYDEDATPSEQIVVLWESRLTEAESAALAARIAERVREQLGLAAVQVVAVPPRTIPHTTSGKVQRSAALRLCLESDLLASGDMPVESTERN